MNAGRHIVDIAKDFIATHESKINNNQYGQITAIIANLLKDKHYNAASEFLVDECKKRYWFITTKVDDVNEIWVYNDGIYTPNAKSIIKEECRKMTDMQYNEKLVNQVIAKIEADTFMDQDKFFNNTSKNEIAVKNGILNLDTKELMVFDPKKIFFAKVNAEYIPGASCPKIDAFFREVLPDDNDVKTLYELFGYSLYKDNFLERAFMFLGSGRNGKSKCLTILKHFLNPENITAMPLQKLENGDFKECGLLNKLANIAGDISGYPIKETSKFKALCGRDTITASRKFKNDVTFVNYAKMIFSTNNLPKTYDLTTGFFDRWVFLVFPYTFKAKNEYDELMKILPDSEKYKYKIMDEHRIDGLFDDAEMSGLLNMALEGLDRVNHNHAFTSSKSGEDTKSFWIKNSDSFLAFAWAKIDIDPDGHIFKADLRKEYQKYCKIHKIMSEGDRHIKECLVRNFTAGEEFKTNPTQGQQTWAWTGIKFKGPLAAL